MGKCKTIAIQTDFRIFSPNRAYSGIIQAYLDIFWTLINTDLLWTLGYPEHWHIQHQRHIQNSDIFTTLEYSELQYI